MATQSAAEGQATAVSGVLPSTLLTVQAPAPPVGFVEVITFPPLSTPTHSEFDAHETATTTLVVPSTPTTSFHAPVPAVGLVETKTSASNIPVFLFWTWRLPDATQSDGDGQETVLGPPAPSVMLAELQAPAPPVGSVAVTISPPPSSATQRAVETHETPAKPNVFVMLAGVHPPAPLVGSEEVTRSPVLVPATHSEAAGHDTPYTKAEPSIVTGADQVSGESATAGTAHATSSPRLTTRTAITRRMSRAQLEEAGAPPARGPEPVLLMLKRERIRSPTTSVWPP